MNYYSFQFTVRYGITIAGWSSDGDQRLLSAMCYQITNYKENGVKYVQDTIHIATKLRNRLLKPSINILMGIKKVSIMHLKSLVRNVQKNIHGLNDTDICSRDRQNFLSFQKIIDKRVTEALKVHVKDSEGTLKYLQICDDVTSSFLDFNLTPLERVFRMFHAVYFLRIWRNHIMLSRNHSLQLNFITSNAYTCIEINAQSLIEIIRDFRNKNMSHNFLITMFDSQTCEKAFRQLRSMGTTNFTKINISLYEVLHKIGRIEVQNDIAYSKFSDKEIEFPASHKKREKTKIFDLPSDNEITYTLEIAKQKAIENALVFGMYSDDIDNYKVPSKLSIFDDDNEDDIYENEDNIHDYDSNDALENENMDEHEQISFTTFTDDDGVERTIRKSTLIWMYTEPGISISKDRLRRVQVNRKRKSSQS